MKDNIYKNIKEIYIENELKNSYLDYAMSVIISRALPDVRDGLKPVHRRILFAMNNLGNLYNKPYKKSARIVGDVIGKYHPHGDNAVYDSIVRMAQNFSLRYILIEGQGNFGSIDGDSAAAMRYTEIKMSKISSEMLYDLEKDTVDFTKNYDETEYIPNILPSRIPNLLINGSYGIAVGVITNIPPHNLYEVINGCLALIDNKDICIEDLMKFIPGPDFPTYGEIHGINDIIQIYKTGKGKICVRSKVNLENINNIKNIVISELPYQVNKLKLIEKIAELVKNKKIDGINNIRDESDKDGIRVVIEIKKEYDYKIILNNLYKHTSLQINLSINMVALKDGKPKILSLIDILNSFIDHRKNIIYKRNLYLLDKNNEKLNITEGLIIAISNINEIIKIIKSSNSLNEAKNNLLYKKWNLDSNIINLKEENKYIFNKENNKYDLKKIVLNNKQIQSILEIKLQRLTNLEYNKLINEYKLLISQIKKSISILKNNNNLIIELKKELIEIQNEYKDKRRTKIILKKKDIDLDKLINKTDVIITLSHKGYIKIQPVSDYESQKRGGKGKLSTKIKDEDFIYILLVANTHDDLLLFSNKGIVYKIKVYQLPELNRYSRGKLIYNILSIDNNNKITAILPIKPNIYNDNYYICMVTLKGFIKKTLLSKFKNLKNVGIIAIKLNLNDLLIDVKITNGDNNIIIFSANGRSVRFLEKKIKSTGRISFGVKGINLIDNDKVVSIIIPKINSHILTVTENGIGKRTIENEYPIKSRFNIGVISIKVTNKSGKVIKSIEVNNEDQLLIITNSGVLVRIKVSEISLIKRNTKGITLIKLLKDDYVVDLQKISN
ncbi:DNA gyrase subunit A [endosymbiont of Pachyrhynchus infernalis]|uniref:DNA gyrase subunit A n=1 Tax=endosymbiont of Pachyrhynchus infernalis TaxID=1971488 RepID=UPI000DC6D877|nr:DNA gyrase subunit A [endosymbiont of Pachyrhynchus infernalis]BBA84806.1 DNA gyrase subunit A [endosymbiont of Pachyrhynchus infernalis]